MRALQQSFKWHLVSRPMLWIYRREWARRNVPVFSLLTGFLLGSLLAIALHNWAAVF